MTTSRSATGTSTASRARDPLYSALIGLTTLAILLQGAWAGIFIREGQANKDNWVMVHDWGARVAIALALASTVVAFVRLRPRTDLLIGSAALTVLLFLEAYIGGLIGDHAGAQVIHFPLAMALLGLAVWLPFRARTGGR